MNEGENPNTSQAGHPHGHFGSRRYRSPSGEDQYNAATNLANDPNTPEFFSNAVMASTPVPQPRKSRKGLIIGIVAAVIVIVIILIVVLIPKNPSSGNEPGGGEVTQELKAEFAIYLNMLTANKSTSEALDYNKIREEQGGLFADSVIYGGDVDVDRVEYIDNLNKQFEKVEKLYNEQFDDDNMHNIQLFYYHYGLINPIDENKLVSYYKDNGKSLTFDYITNSYRTNSDDEMMVSYVNNYRNVLMIELDAVEYGFEHNCIVNGVSNQSCISKMPGFDKKIKEANKSAQAASDAHRDIKQNADKALHEVSNKVLGSDFGSTNSGSSGKSSGSGNSSNSGNSGNSGGSGSSGSSGRPNWGVRHDL